MHCLLYPILILKLHFCCLHSYWYWCLTQYSFCFVVTVLTLPIYLSNNSLLFMFARIPYFLIYFLYAYLSIYQFLVVDSLQSEPNYDFLKSLHLFWLTLTLHLDYCYLILNSISLLTALSIFSSHHSHSNYRRLS